MSTRWLDRLLLATLFVQTMEKIQWQGGGLSLTITNITCLAFVAAFLLTETRSAGCRRWPEHTRPTRS